MERPNSITDTAISLSSLKVAPSYKPSTQCVHVEASITDLYNSSSVPIYQSATFKQTSVSDMGLYDYSRSGNPTRTQTETHLAKLMKAERALLISSGMGALDVITRLCKSNQEIVAGDDIYGGNVVWKQQLEM